MAVFVLVHGAWGGSWGYASLARRLRAAGHEVHVPSLTGLGERAHLAHGGITLSDHIADVIGLIDCESLNDFILVGHSYGGMVITGVSALRGSRIRSLVYLDAFLPEDGQALWDVADEVTRQSYIENQKNSPGLVQPIFPMPEGRTARVSGHPLLTLLEPVRLGGEEGQIRQRTYVYANRSPLTIFTQFRDRCAENPDWRVEEIGTGHMLWDDDLQGTLRILLDEAARS